MQNCEGKCSLSFDKFVQNLKDPEFLLKGCQVFCDKYEDNVSFAVQTLWQDFLRGGKKTSKNVILGGAEALLLKWNQAFYKNYPRLMEKIEDDLEDAYDSTLPSLEQLYPIRLGQPNLNKHFKDIGVLYENYKRKSSISMTGASKALHFIHPELFVAWDAKIREYYHKNDPSHNKQHKVGSFECYIDFMKTCNDIATDLLKKRTLNELVLRHPAYVEYKQIRSLPKMLDECNWCWIFKNERW